MKEEVKIPSVGESIVEGVLSAWLKESGDFISLDEDLYEFETEKANVVVPSPFEGILEIIVEEGSKVNIDQVIATIDTDAAPDTSQKEKAEKPAGEEKKTIQEEEKTAGSENHRAESKEAKKEEQEGSGKTQDELLSPAVRRIAEENKIDLSAVKGTGKDGRITKADLLDKTGREPEDKASGIKEQPGPDMEGPIKRIPMSVIRKSIAGHMLSARQGAAHLTTFNEIDMKKLVEIRKTHQESFQKKFGIKLGFMSFFVKASVQALKEFPVINARIEGEDIVYYEFYDIGIAVSTERGLLVPVLKNADKLTFAEIEEKIADLAERTKNKKITLPELMGGTFSITNGGIFGSLMSTPIPNHPQPAILGMHAVKDRPVAVNGEVKIRPMMYVALTYDHRLIDGREAVSFLARIREFIEDPEDLLLNI